MPSSYRTIGRLALLGLTALTLASGCSDGDSTGSTDPTGPGAATTVVTSDEGDDRPTGTTPDGATTTTATATTVAEDGLGEPERPYLESLAPEGGAPDDRCAAVQFLDLVGADRLASAGIDPASLGEGDFDAVVARLALDRDTAEAVHDRWVACGQDPAERFVEDLLAGRDAGPGVAACVQDRLDRAAIRDLVVSSLRGEPVEDPDLGDLAPCFAPG